MTPFALVTEREVSREDKKFICNIMKIDPRDRLQLRSYCKMLGLMKMLVNQNRSEWFNI